MKVKFNFKTILVLLVAIFATFALAACDNGVEAELEEAINSITLGDLNSLKADFKLVAKTNKHDLDIKWELIDSDDTLELEKVGEDWWVRVTPTEYKEDAEGNPTNEWGTGTLKAVVEKDGKSVDRKWDLNVKPGEFVEPDLTIALAKTKDKGTVIALDGLVTFVAPQGFYIEDSSGTIYVFLKATPAAEVKAGAVVSVQGELDIYYGIPQISNSPVVTVKTPATEAGYSYDNVPEKTIGEVNELKAANDPIGTMYRVSGRVIKDYKSPADQSTVSQYALQDALTGEVAAIYNSTSQAVKTALEAKVGEYVSIVILLADFHSSQLVWRNYGVDGTLKDAVEPQLDDETKVAVAVADIEEKFAGKSFATDLDLPLVGPSGGTITWTSANTAVLANDGKVTTPTEDTDVVLNYVVTSGEEEATGSVTVTIKAVTISTVKEAIDLLDVEDTFVAVEGIIIGTDLDGYYYLADATGNLFIRHKLSDDGLVVGNKVRVYGIGTIFNKTNQFTRQIDKEYSVVKLDDQLHASPQEPVVAAITDFDFTITTANIMTEAPKEELYGKIVKITGFVKPLGTYNNLHLVASMDSDDVKIMIYHKTLADAEIRALTGVEVTMVAVVYQYHTTDGWKLSFLDRDGDLTYELTEAQKLAMAKAEVEKVVVDDKAVSGDLDFFTTTDVSAISTAKFVWSTNNAAIGSDGKFTAPTADTDVKVTVKVYLSGDVSGTANAEWEYDVVAKAPVVTTGGVMMSQIYGGGGNSGAEYKNDFIELYNSSDEDIDLTGWTVWYASATGAFKVQGSESYDTAFTLTSGVIKAKSFFLIQAAAGSGGTKDLPTPDATTGLGLGATGFKVALTNDNVLPTGPDAANVVDFVGAAANASLYEGTGPAPAPSNTTAVIRATLVDTNDNAADFTVVAPAPRNSAYIPA